jgi:hypothetical protein
VPDGAWEQIVALAERLGLRANSLPDWQ